MRELLYHVNEMLESINEEVTVFEQEYFPELSAFQNSNEPYTVAYDEDAEEYVVEGPRIEKCWVIPIWRAKRALPSSRIS